MSKSAKEMFEDLGYKINNEFYDKCYIAYVKNEDLEIIFDMEDKDFTKQCPLGNVCINMKELQAINKQIEELGWNNE